MKRWVEVKAMTIPGLALTSTWLGLRTLARGPREGILYRLRVPLIGFLETVVRRSRVHPYLAFLRRFYALPMHEQRKLQEERVTRLLQHAAIHVPYYRRVLPETGVYTNGAVDLRHFHRIPFLTRSILQNQFEELKSDDLDHRKWFLNASGGSTGEPVRFVQDREYDDWSEANQLLERMHAGWKMGEPMVFVWGSARDITHGTVGLKAKLAGAIRNRTLLNCFAMSESLMTSHVHRITGLRPVLMEAYAEGAYQLAHFMNQRSLSFSGMRAVITTAGNLLPFMRSEIEKACNCPVYDRYGSREVGGLAIERQPGASMMVHGYTNLVEVVDGEGQPCAAGEEGEVVVTSLSNHAMPLIRYRIGDLAVVGDRPSPSLHHVSILRHVAGRVMDSFVKRDGSVVSPNFFIHFLAIVHNTGWMRKLQFLQEDYERVKVKLAVSATPPEGVLGQIANNVKKVMGSSCHVEFDFVDDIPSAAPGKYRYTISLVPRS